MVNPSDEKFRRLRLSNAKISAALTKVPDFLQNALLHALSCHLAQEALSSKLHVALITTQKLFTPGAQRAVAMLALGRVRDEHVVRNQSSNPDLSDTPLGP